MTNPTHSLAVAIALSTVLLAGCIGAPETPRDGKSFDSGYSPLLATEIRGLSEKEIDDLRSGAGAGFALPAELNGYPGPRHVLDMRDDLALTESQHERMRTLYDAMKLDATRKGEELLAAHAALEAAFRNGTIDEDALDALVGDVAETRGELQAVHLRAHLEAFRVLTPDQVHRYNNLRGYGDAHDGHEGRNVHGHGG